MFVRQCPKCKNDVVHKTKYKRNYAEKINRFCGRCGALTRYSLEKRPDADVIDGERKFFRKCPNCNRKIFYKKLGHKNQLEKQNSLCNPCRREHRQFIYPNFNPNACRLIEEFGKKNGYKFQHAMNGGEIVLSEFGYYLDGYDKERNVVIEVDEPRHKYTQKLDKLREENILNYLKCKLIRMDINGNITVTRKYIRPSKNISQ